MMLEPSELKLHITAKGWQVIHSEGERKAAKALTEAALLLEQNSACLPLRYLQVGNGSILDVQQAEYEKARIDQTLS